MDWKASLESLRSGLPDGPEVADSADEAAPAKSAAVCRLHVLLDRKGRKGKEATIVEGFTCTDAEVDAVASGIKQKLGVGGSARGGEILIQGDKRQPVAEILRSLGFKVVVG